MTAPDDGVGPGGSTASDPPGDPGVPGQDMTAVTGQDMTAVTGQAAVPEGARFGGYGVLAAGAIALGMHLMVGGSYALTLVLAPVWVSVVLALWWLVLLFAGLGLLARRSLFVLVVPLLAIVSWAALISAGRSWLGWP